MKKNNIISSETLFHFTKSADSLISILKNEFHPKYSLEDWTSFVWTPNNKDSKHEVAVPMVCFCDLPLSKIVDHLVFYGNYGIGLSKDWGVRNGINPVIYLNSKSYLNNYFVAISKYIMNLGYSDKGLNKININLYEFLSFIKMYEGKMWRNYRYVPKRFYDEREWRFVPKLLRDGEIVNTEGYRLSKSDYLNNITRANANERIAEKVKLRFGPEDIKYLIVNSESEIFALIKAISEIKQKYSDDIKKILYSRIISTEQIKSDF